MRHLKFRKKRKRAPHKAKLHFLSEKIHWNKKAVALWIAEIAVVCALAFILVFYFGQRVSNAGDSMRPELKNGDVVLVNRLVYNAMTPKRGDIIAFKPNGRENAHYYIKRIVGLPGETVQIRMEKYILTEKNRKKISLCPKLKSRELPRMRSHLVRMSILYWEIRRPAAMTAGWLISEM